MCYVPRAVSEADQRLIKRIDALNLAHPFGGSRMLRDMFNRESFDVGRRHVATLMRRMGIQARSRKPNTSKKHPTHKVYPPGHHRRRLHGQPEPVQEQPAPAAADAHSCLDQPATRGEKADQ